MSLLEYYENPNFKIFSFWLRTRANRSEDSSAKQLWVIMSSIGNCPLLFPKKQKAHNTKSLPQA